MPGGFAGHKAVLRYESTWVDGQNVPAMPTWVEIKIARDISMPGTQTEAEASDRRTDDVTDVGGMNDNTISGELTWSPAADTVYDKLHTSKQNNTPILIQYLTGTATGSKGFQMPMICKTLGANAPLAGSGAVPFELRQFPALDAAGAVIPYSTVTVS